VLHDSFLSECVAALSGRPDAVLAFAPCVVIDEEGREERRTVAALPVDSTDVVMRFGSLLEAVDPTHNMFYSVIRRDVLLRTPLLGMQLAADRCLLAELSLHGPFVRVDGGLFARRIHSGQLNRSDEDDAYLYAATARSFSREWGVLRANVGAVWRAPLAAGTKVRLLGALFGSAVRHRSTLLQELLDFPRWAARRLGWRRVGRPASARAASAPPLTPGP
jgi:hypothetical protein